MAKKSTNALLLSALVFPGAGHIYLKKIKTGVTLIGLTLVALIYIISDIMGQAFNVVEQIQLGTIMPDTTSIRTMIEQQPGGKWIGIASYLIVACWLIGVIGCYLDNKKAK